MAKGIGPLLLLGGAAALAVAASRKKSGGGGSSSVGQILAEGSRANGMHILMYYQVRSVLKTPGFAAGPGNIAYQGFVATLANYSSNAWESLDIHFDTPEEAEANALSHLENLGFINEE